MNIIPAGHRILVKLDEVKATTDWGFALVSDNKKHEREQYATQEAIVILLGKDAYKGFGDGQPWCKVGDKVLIAKYAGEDRQNPETKEILRVINDDDVIAILEE